MESPPPPPPPPSSSTSTQKSKGKSIQLIDMETSKATSSFESDSGLKDELIDREPSKATFSFGVSFESDSGLNDELIDGEPSQINSLFSKIEPGDPVDEVLKNMVSVIKDSGQIDKEIGIIKSYQKHAPLESHESLDNALIDLYKVKITEDISNSNESPYIKAKHAEEKEKDLVLASFLYYEALNRNDRFDSALKDLACVLKQRGQTDEAIAVIKNNRRRCSKQSQDSLDNLLVMFYKSDHNRSAEYINFLEEKLELLESGTTFEGKETKVVAVKAQRKNMVKAKRKNIVISFDQERARLQGNIAWLYMQQGNYDTAEQYFSTALSLKPDKNNQCNLAICLMKSGRISEAESPLKVVTPSPNQREIADSYAKSYDRAWKMLTELGHGDI